MTMHADPAGQPGYYAMNMIAICAAQLGKPYVWGATGPDSFDCSGLIMYAAQQCKLPVAGRWTTYTMVALADRITIGTQMPGDWIFPSAGHVGIYIGGGKYINAPTEGQPVQVSAVPGGLYAVGRYYPPTDGDHAAVAFEIATKGLDIANALGAGLAGAIGAIGTTGQAAGQSIIEANPLYGVGKVLGWLADKKNWIRIGYGVAGATALGLGIASVAGRSL